jgi:tRNA-2-methylthio-N6-dimethylallyladenosine synthase
VPYTRGQERSAHGESSTGAGLVASGLRDRLLGRPSTPTAALVRRQPRSSGVAAVDGLERVRYVTSHPRHFDDELIEVLARRPSVSRYLHLPVQAGSDRILRRMHRRYTRDGYVELVSRIRRAVPDINLSTDVIVGFPGETEQDFVATLELVEQLRFGQVFGFAFSLTRGPRPPAADQVPDGVRRSGSSVCSRSPTGCR